MSFQIYDDNALRSPSLASFDEFGILPLVYAAAVGAVAAGGLVAGWLSKDDWSVGEYNAYMNEMYQTILLWDKIGWQKSCWADASRRARWVLFMNAFGKHYSQYGKISSASFVSDSEEKPARDFARKLADWGTELNASCGTAIPSILPPAPDPDHKPTEPVDYLQWGVYLVLGILGLQVVSAVRSATGPRA